VVVTHGELDRGVSGVAAPVLGPRGRLLAGLTLAGPTERLIPSVERLSVAVRAAAGAIEQALPER
jgi:DNA-binding IclR family transcriptional regulator